MKTYIRHCDYLCSFIAPAPGVKLEVVRLAHPVIDTPCVTVSGNQKAI